MSYLSEFNKAVKQAKASAPLTVLHFTIAGYDIELNTHESGEIGNTFTRISLSTLNGRFTSQAKIKEVLRNAI